MSQNCKTYPEVYGVQTFSEVTGYKTSSVYVLIHQRKVPFYKRPGSSKVLFRHREVIDWLTQKRIPTISEIAENAMV